MSKVRKLSTISNIEELKLDEKSSKTILANGYSVQDVILAARDGRLEKLKGIGPASARKILTAVNNAGFIFSETVDSRAVRNLLSAIFKYKVTTTEAYEAQTGFSLDQITAMKQLLNEKLTIRDATLLELRFGLTVANPLTREATGEQFYITGERVRQLEIRALRKMRYHTRAIILAEIFPEYPGIPEELKTVREKLEDPELSTEEKPLEWLELPIRTHNCLKRAKVDTVEKLLQLTPEELLKIRNFGKHDLKEVQMTLNKFNLSLRS